MDADFWLNHWPSNARLDCLSLDNFYGSILSSYWILKGRLLDMPKSQVVKSWQKSDLISAFFSFENHREMFPTLIIAHFSYFAPIFFLANPRWVETLPLLIHNLLEISVSV